MRIIFANDHKIEIAKARAKSGDEGWKLTNICLRQKGFILQQKHDLADLLSPKLA